MSAGHSLLGKTLKGYKLVSLLGEGGMGTVFRAEHPLIGKTVAIKLLRPEFCTIESQVERFLWEAKAVNEISHENIIDIIDFDYDEGRRPYLVMEFVDGRSLDDIVDTESAFSVERVSHIALQLCSALSSTHEKGIIHRDLKSENIYLINKIGRSDFVKILDFGIAKILGGQPKLAQTNAGAILGTPGYMAPEQFRGTTVDAKTDVYAVGVILFEMFTRRLPFEEEGIVQLFDRQQTEDPPSLRTFRADISDDWGALVARCLAREAKDRFASMRELAEAISQISKHNPKEYFLSWTPSWSSLEEQGETVRISPLAEEEENILEEVVPSGEVFTLDAIDLSQVTLRIPTEKSAEITLPQKTQRRVVEGRGSLSDSPTQRRSTNKTEELPPPEVSAGLSPEIENWFVLSKKMSSVSDTAELVRTRSPGDDAVPISELAVTAYTDFIASQETRPLSTLDLASMETRQISPSEAKGVMTADLKVQNQERTKSLRSWYLSLAVCLVFGIVIGLILSQRKPTLVMEDVVEAPVLKYTPPQEEPLAVKVEEPTPSVVVARPVVVASKKQTASLVLGSNVSCECFLNGESVGFTPCISKELQSGTYSVRLKNSAFGIEEQFSVTLAAGEEKKIRKQFSFAQ